jgi:23S rRNA (uracil1939-C5)-methyltransferase
MVQPGQKLIGVEVVHSAVENARQNAARAGVTDAEFLCADAGKASQILAERGLRPDVIVLDPPRKGCDNDTLQAVVRMAPSRIIMVSCNPATMARDAAILREMGYDLQCYRPVDLFPRTSHCETVGLFTKQ